MSGPVTNKLRPPKSNRAENEAEDGKTGTSAARTSCGIYWLKYDHPADFDTFGECVGQLAGAFAAHIGWSERH